MAEIQPQRIQSARERTQRTLQRDKGTKEHRNIGIKETANSELRTAKSEKRTANSELRTANYP